MFLHQLRAVVKATFVLALCSVELGLFPGTAVVRGTFLMNFAVEVLEEAVAAALGPESEVKYWSWWTELA